MEGLLGVGWVLIWGILGLHRIPAPDGFWGFMAKDFMVTGLGISGLGLEFRV